MWKVYSCGGLRMAKGEHMPKAFTQEEKQIIKEKLMETALNLFHDKGTKSLSIAELTRRVGIAQGSFYTFWKNKDALIIELIAYRARQKLYSTEKKFSASLTNPAEFLTDIIYTSSIDLMTKIKTQPIYKDAFKVFEATGQNEAHKIEILYQDFLTKLVSYWNQNGVIKWADQKGLMSAFIGSSVLCSQCYQFDTAYFNDVLRIYIAAIVNKYIEV